MQLPKFGNVRFSLILRGKIVFGTRGARDLLALVLMDYWIYRATQFAFTQFAMGKLVQTGIIYCPVENCVIWALDNILWAAKPMLTLIFHLLARSRWRAWPLPSRAAEPTPSVCCELLTLFLRLFLRCTYRLFLVTAPNSNVFRALPLSLCY